MRRLFLFLPLLAATCSPAPAQESMEELCDRVYSLARQQAVYMDSLLAEGRYPRTFQGDTLVTSDIGWWCSGFYPGVLWDLYFEYPDDASLRRLAVKRTMPLADLLERETDHDIGFQLMSSFRKWERIRRIRDNRHFDRVDEGEFTQSEVQDILRRGAEKLAARFVPEAGVIRSWNWGEWDVPVIIDNMMNLSLLCEYGDRDIAVKHALTTVKNHFHEDGTAWHLVDYSSIDGSIHGKQTVQGYSDETAWARGQAWALYGFSFMAIEELGEGNLENAKIFHDTAVRLAEWILPRLPEDGIPYWDFSQKDYKDASAAAILACGLSWLWEYDLTSLNYEQMSRQALRNPLVQTMEKILRTLASPEYLAEPRTNGGFLLKHSVGNLPGGTEVDVPLTYADYYFLEALSLFPD